MQNIIILMLFLLLLSGCTSMKHNGVTVNKTQINFPPIEQIMTKNLGEKLVEKGYITTQKALVVNQEMKSLAYDIPAKQYKQTGFDDKGLYFEPWGVIKAALADPFSGLTIKHKSPNEVCVITVFNATSCIEGTFEIKDVQSIETPMFSQTLIYTGKVGSKIRFAYREFSNSLARPAFNIEVEYDLKQSDVVGYQNAKIQVIEATNTSIKYKLISNF